MNRQQHVAVRREAFGAALRNSIAAAALAAAACLPAQSLLAQAGSSAGGGAAGAAGVNAGAAGAAGVNPNAPAAQGVNPNAPVAQGLSPAATGRAYYDDSTFQALGPLASRYGVPYATNRTPTVGDTPGDGLGADERPGYGYNGDDNNVQPFFYDYYGYNPYYSYGPTFPTAVPGTGVAPPATYFSYRDYDNDGFYDRYYSSRDADNDGVLDSYELAYARRAAAANRVAMREAAREQDQAERRAALAANPGVTVDGGLGDASPREAEVPRFERRTLTGVVVTAKTAMVNGREHTVVQVRSDAGQTEVVDMGSADITPAASILPGTDVVVTGVVQPVGKQQVLFADEATIDDRLVKIDRRDASQQGTVVEVVRAPVAGAEHTIAVVDVDGTRRMVDLGEMTPQDLGVAAQAVVSYRGVPIRLGEYPVTMAYEVTVDGKEIPLQR